MHLFKQYLVGQQTKHVSKGKKTKQTVTTHLFNDPDNDHFSPERETMSL